MSQLTEDLERRIEELETEVVRLVPLAAKVPRLEAENKRLMKKCNRMLPSAKLEDIQEVV